MSTKSLFDWPEPDIAYQLDDRVNIWRERALLAAEHAGIAHEAVESVTTALGYNAGEIATDQLACHVRNTKALADKLQTLLDSKTHAYEAIFNEAQHLSNRVEALHAEMEIIRHENDFNADMAKRWQADCESARKAIAQTMEVLMPHVDISAIRKIVWNLSDAPQQGENMNHKLDTDQQVFFYEQDFYVLSNFSAFRVKWQGIDFDTSEHAYHWEKFRDHPDAWNAAGSIAEQVRRAPSAHSAFKLAERCKPRRRPDWDDVKVKIMRGLLKAKVDQHEYVRRKLLETGTRELVEDSWRDDFWGWGPNKDGKNMLGRLWMEIREELRAASQCGIAA